MEHRAIILKSQQRLVLLGFLVSVLFISLVVNLRVAHAAEGDAEAITLSPASQDLKLSAGEIYKGSFKVINSGKEIFTYSVYPRPYFVVDENYDPTFEKIGTNTDLFEWLSFESASYTIKPGETREIPYSIRVPATASPGGHYGVVFAESQPPKESTQSVIRKKRVGMIVRATIEGKSILKGSVLSSSAQFWQTIPPLRASVRIKNDGNTDFQSTNTLIVKDMFGNVKQKIIKQIVVYPGTIRKLEMSWDDAPWFGLFKVEIESKLLSQSDSATHYVLILPRWLALTVLVFSVGGVSYVLLRRR